MRVIETYKSRKSNTRYVVSEENSKTYLTAEGEMSTNPKVIKQCNDVRNGQFDAATTLWIARQMSNTF